MFGEKVKPVLKYHGGGSARFDVFAKSPIRQFGAQRRPPLGLRAYRKCRQRQFGFGLEIADGKTGVAVALARKKARYVAKIFALQRQRLVFRVALEEDELTAEILGEAVDAAPGRMRQQLVAVCRQVGGAQFVETRMRNLEGRGKALRQ